MNQARSEASGTEPGTEEPDIFHYTNYRQFLKDYFQFKKSRNPRFSFRMFAGQAGFSSHSILQFIFDGKRNLSKKSVIKIVNALGLSKKKADFFEALVFFNQAGTREEKNAFYNELLRIVPRHHAARLNDDQYGIFSRWFVPVIREMLNLKNFNPSPAWIAETLRGQVKPAQAAEALDLLLKSGMIKKGPGRLALSETNVATDDEVNPLLVKNYHYEMITRAIASMDEVPGDERDISAAGFSIKKDDFEKLKKHLQLMRKELFQFQAGEGEGDMVVQVNLQLFPLTKPC